MIGVFSPFLIDRAVTVASWAPALALASRRYVIDRWRTVGTAFGRRCTRGRRRGHRRSLASSVLTANIRSIARTAARYHGAQWRTRSRSGSGAREHNLRNVDLELPRDKLIVFTGLSGSGKSSLAFDTIYAEGQRRYVESLSAYARQFLGQMDKPDVDFIEGLSPAISIDQKSASRNPRSTVGTITEIYDYLRPALRPHRGPALPELRAGHHPPDAAADRRPRAAARGGHPVPGARAGRARPQGRVRGLLKELASQGFTRARVDGELVELGSGSRLARYENHTIEVVVDRLVRRTGIERRLTDSLETALRLAEGVAEVEIVPQARCGSRRTPRRSRSPSTSRARTAASRSTSSRPATSRSTRRTARASGATASARASRSTPSSSSPTTT